MRLIDADAMIKRLKAWDTNDVTDKALYNFALNRVLEAPTIKQERKKGKWTLVNGRTSINCSTCWHCNWSREFEQTVRQFKFCPNCGAIMENKESDG